MYNELAGAVLELPNLALDLGPIADLQLGGAISYAPVQTSTMFSGIDVATTVTNVGTLGALIVAPIGVVAAFWGTRQVIRIFKGVTRG